MVSVPDGSCLQRGQVGAGVRLCVADREVHFPSQDAFQEEFFLLLGSELTDCWTHRVGCEERNGTASSLRLVEEDVLLNWGESSTSVFDGPSDPQPAVLSYSANQRLVLEVLSELCTGDPPAYLVGHQVGEVGPQFVLEGLLVLSEVDEHNLVPGGGQFRGTVSQAAPL